MSNYVLWSGGYDSTLLLYQLARDNPNELINAVTVTGINQDALQIKAEAKARQKLKNLIKLTNIQYHTINVEYTNTNDNFQMRYWLSIIMPILHDNDILNIAYLSSDGADFFVLKQEYTDAFHSFMRLREIKCTLNFPFMYKTKGYVISELKKIKLLKHAWACGQPKKNGKACGKCTKCISVKRWTKYPDRGADV